MNGLATPGVIPPYDELRNVVNDTVEAFDGEESVSLRFSALSERSDVGPFESFTLEFEGAVSSPLDQGTFRIQHSTFDAFELFLTPIAQAERVRTYQAVVTRAPQTTSSQR